MVKAFLEKETHVFFKAILILGLALFSCIQCVKAEQVNLSFNGNSSMFSLIYYKGKDYFFGSKDYVVESKDEKGNIYKSGMTIGALFDGEKYIMLNKEERLQKIDYVYSDGERLFGFSSRDGIFYELEISEDEVRIVDEYSFFKEYANEELCCNMGFAISGRVYLARYRGYEKEAHSTENYELIPIEIDFSKKNVRQLDVSCIELGKMGDDKAFFVEAKKENTFIFGDRKVFNLFEFDVNTGKTKKTLSFNAKIESELDVAYSERLKKLFFAYDNAVSMLENGRLNYFADIPSKFYHLNNERKFFVLSDGRLVYMMSKSDYEQMIFISDLADIKDELVVSGFNLLPQAQEQLISNLQGEKRLKLKKLSGNQLKNIENKIFIDDDYDILFLSSENIDIERLVKKGYAQKLESRRLNESIMGMHDFLKAYAGKNGENYCLPICYHIVYHELNGKALKELGENVPSSYTEFYNMLLRLSKALDNSEKYRLFEDEFNAKNEIDFVIKNAILENSSGNGKMSFNENELKQSLEAIMRAKQSLKTAVKLEDNGYIAHYSGKGELISRVGDFSAGFSAYEDGEVFMPVVLKNNADSKNFLSADIGFFIVNPRSERKEKAFELLEKIVEMQGKTDKFALFKGENKPIENIEEIKRYQEELISLEKMLSNENRPTIKKELQESIEKTKKNMESDRYIISPKDVEKFEKLIELNPVVGRRLDKFYSAVHGKTEMLVDDRISVEQFIKEVKNVINLIELEEK